MGAYAVRQMHQKIGIDLGSIEPLHAPGGVGLRSASKTIVSHLVLIFSA
jgi:hypothetical protein